MITKFKVVNERAVKLAEYDNVPRIMIIAGPNGVGKSTLLYALKQKRGVEGSGRFLYISPHRAWFKQQIRAMFLLSKQLRWTEFLAAEQMPGVEGLNLRGFPRRFDSIDESPSTIKYVLGQLEIRRRNILTSTYDQKGLVEKGDVPDIHEPLQKLVSFLLPHLRFERVDLTTPDNVRCIFSHLHQPVNSGYLEIDIDELSSGEREVIAIFLTFIEKQVQKLMAKYEKSVPEPEQDMVVLIDTPELHLHPELQSRLLEYFRSVAKEDNVQFIIATHSPVIVNDATYEELFVLTPPQPLEGYNQLVKIATNAERLELIRSMSGNTFVFTTGKPVVFIEGITPVDASREPSDKRLLELMGPEFTRFVLVPMGDRNRIESLIKGIASSTEIGELGLNLFGIVDNDRTDEGEEIDALFRWPVCSIENFMLNKDAIWEVLEAHREKLGWTSPADVLNALKSVAKEIRNEEIQLRISNALGSFSWHFKGMNYENLDGNYRQGLAKFNELFKKEKVASTIKKATSEVDEILSKGKELEMFSGKRILKLFHAKFVGNLGMNYQVFCYQVAERIGRKERPAGIILIKDQIERFIPRRLVDSLKDLLKILKENKQELNLSDAIINSIEDCVKDVEVASDKLKVGKTNEIDQLSLKKKCWSGLLQVRQHLTTLGQEKAHVAAKVNPPLDLAFNLTARMLIPG